MSRTLSALILLLAAALAAAPAVAQRPLQRGAHWPDAAGVVRMIVEGQQPGVAVSTALHTCPQQNPYGDSVWVALLAAPATPELTYRLASGWANALRSCSDPRIEAWYRARLAEATDLLSAYPIVSAMLRHGTPETVVALKGVAFDGTRNDELRSAILRGLAEDWDRRVDIYLEAAAATERFPEPYGQAEWAALSSSPVAATFALRALDVIERQPNRNTASLLMRLASMAGMDTLPQLRIRLEAVTQAILSAPPAHYPAVLRDAAVGARATLDRAGAQQPSSEALLAEFARFAEASATSLRSLPPHPRLPHVLVAPSQYPPTTLAGVLDGLENLALTSPNASVRASAASWLSGAGEVGSMGATGLADQNVALRLGRVWERTDDAGLRGEILARMWAQANARKRSGC